MKTNNGLIKLWSRQHRKVLEVLNKNQIYTVKKAYIAEKFDTISNFYFDIYNWYIDRAEKVIPRPEGVKYPIWCFTRPEQMLQPVENTVVLELEVPIHLVIFTDLNKWGYVVNYWYLPLNKDDEENHDRELKNMGISNESDIYMGDLGNFYPLLKRKIVKSWDRLFEQDINLEDVQTIYQATLWEIKPEWVKHYLVKAGDNYG